ncbi:heterokaryon incompatibility protein (HET) domain-containing protein [Sarocladium implicatum]|nr:heterokaryon incompatibility protein (HET) domain-containing protein [Sarocladium implicatum]
MSGQLYDRLDPSRQEIRLLEVSHDHGSDDADKEPCRLAMTTHSLQDPDLEYIAVSYVWSAGKSADATILVNGHPLVVGGNLHALLLRLRNGGFKTWPLGRMVHYDTRETIPTHVRRFWVDAISINQQDIQEKNWTVQMMGQVFARAHLTIGWLGEGHARVEAAMPQLTELCFDIAEADESRADLSNRDRDTSWIKAEDSHIWQADTADMTYAEAQLYGNPFWYGVQALCEDSFWFRAWTFQETILSKHLMLCAGPQSLHFGHLSALRCKIVPLANRGYSPPSFVNKPLWETICSPRCALRILLYHVLMHTEARGSWAIKREAEDIMQEPTQEKVHTDWFYLVIRTRGRKASDPRDKLYSVLGLLDHKIKPDYDSSSEEVYTAFTKALLRRGKPRGLEILTLAGVFQPLAGVAGDTSHQCLFLPSWVVKWDKLVHTNGSTWLMDGLIALNQGPYESNFADWKHEQVADSLAEVEEGSLRVRGIICDEVSLVCEGIAGKQSVSYCSDCERGMCPAGGSYRDEVPSNRMLHFCDHVMGRRRRPRYPTGIMVLEALARMYVLDRSPLQRVPLCHPETAPQDPALSEELVELAWSLDSWGINEVSDVLDPRQDLRTIIEQPWGDEFAQEQYGKAKKQWREMLGLYDRGTVETEDFMHHFLGPRSDRSALHRRSRRERRRKWLKNARKYLGTDDYDRFRETHVKLAFNSRESSAVQTRDGYIGWAPIGTVPSDIVAVVLGCSMPLVMRHVHDSKYQLIGACWIFGMMNGEAVTAVKEGEKSVQTFELV